MKAACERVMSVHPTSDHLMRDAIGPHCTSAHRPVCSVSFDPIALNRIRSDGRLGSEHKRSRAQPLCSCAHSSRFFRGARTSADDFDFQLPRAISTNWASKRYIKSVQYTQAYVSTCEVLPSVHTIQYCILYVLFRWRAAYNTSIVPYYSTVHQGTGTLTPRSSSLQEPKPNVQIPITIESCELSSVDIKNIFLSLIFRPVLLSMLIE